MPTDKNGFMLMGLIVSPFLWVMQRSDNLVICLIMYAISFAIMFVLIAVVVLSIGWLAIFPFWMLGMIDQVRSGNTGAALLHVGLVLLYYSLFIPFLAWCCKDYEGEDDE